MTINQTVRLLLMEDSPSDALLLHEAFADAADTRFVITQVDRLAEGISLLAKEAFDVVLLDLGLPDSQGIETFIRLYNHTPEVPVVVLTGLDDEAVGFKAVQLGAQDYLQKKQMQTALLERSVRYAIDRHRLQQELERARQHEAQEQEFRSMARLSDASSTEVTAQIYSAEPLRDTFPDVFVRMVARYEELLEQAFDQRVFKVNNHCGEGLHSLSDDLGVLRAGPRDVIEIHNSVLRKKVTDVPPKKAQVYLEEGRIAVLELMGYLADHYRNYFSGSRGVTIQGHE